MAFLRVGGRARRGEMGEQRVGRHGIVRAAAVIAFAGLVAACASGSPEPAPVILKGGAPGYAGAAAGIPAPARRRPGAGSRTPPSASAAAPRPQPGPRPASAARAESAGPAPALPHGGHFPWPVRGHVLAGYGVAAGGAHNDGINIAAPRGAPVSAVDAGIVAYAGNELRGYGNLLLVKHASGWITAYAHCHELLVN